MPFLHSRIKPDSWFKRAEKQTFSTGLRHKIFQTKGGYYKGDWVDGKRSGKGVELLPNDLQYEGDWKCDKKDGFGILSKYNDSDKSLRTVYLGDFKRDKMHGYGYLHYENGTFYEGEFKNGKKFGYGRCWFNDGSYYEGYWIRDLEDGFGMLVKANGNRYEGEWRFGKKEGWGVYYHLDCGQKQVGIWSNDTCVTSIIQDIEYRQSALFPTKYPMPPLELHPLCPRLLLLASADDNLLIYNEGCQLHKYCYKIPPKPQKL